MTTMMRSSRPLLARSNMAANTTTPPHIDNVQAGPINIPSIRLISATPSATGLSSDSSTSFNRSLEQSWADLATQQSILAPKSDANEQSRKKLVPKKSKLGLLNIGRDKDKDRARDLSDVVRRVGASASASRGGFEIYVDPMVDPDVGEIVIVKKKKSRVGLDGLTWDALGEATNIPKTTQTRAAQPITKENPAMLKVKAAEDRKWWSIGGGRKDSKEKEKSKGKENKISTSTSSSENTARIIDRSKTPDPLKTTQESRGRFDSFDSDFLLSNPTADKDVSFHSNTPPVRSQTPIVQFSEPEPEPIPERARSATPSTGTFFRSATPTIGGFLAPPGQRPAEDKSGSLAVRAIRSMRSLAKIGGWAQVKGSSPPTAQEMAEEMRKAESEGEKQREKKKKDGTVKKKDGTVKEKTKKDGTVKEKKKAKEDKDKKSLKKKDGSGTVRKSLKGEKVQTMRISTSSFEVGHLSASPEAPKVDVSKKHSILGLGLPSTIRLPRMRGGSTASSLIINAVSSQGQTNPSTDTTVNPKQASGSSSVSQSNRLSVENVIPGRPASAASSNGSSLRPASVASSNSRLSTGSSVLSATSVKWDEQGLETVREQRRKEREERRMSEDSAASVDKAERRTSKESRRSSEGRRRTPISSIFPDVQHQQIGIAMLNDVKEESPEIANPTDSDGASVISMGTTTSSMQSRRRSYGAYPIVTIEEATSDGHGDVDEQEEEVDRDVNNQVNSTATPVKRRARPMSEQLLGKSRPKAIHEDDEGVLSILSAATNDLALLINTLDLQATPSTPDITPFKSSIVKNQADSAVNQVNTRNQETESPLRKTLRRQVSSLASLRPYAQSRGYGTSKPSSNITTAVESHALETKKQNHADLIGQQIAPWPVLIAAVSPAKSNKRVLSDPTEAISPGKTFKPGHKRTMTPAPEPEPEPTFQPLKPARSNAHNGVTVSGKKSNLKLTVDVQSNGEGLEAIFSSRTFSSRSSSGSMTIDEFTSSTGSSGSLTPVFKRIQDIDDLKRASLCPSDYRGKSMSSDACSREQGDSFGESFTVPIAREVCKTLGRSGTLGGSDDVDSLVDASDPDSDVPDELKYILAAHPDKGSIVASREEQNAPVRTLASELLSVSANATHEPPVFRLTLTDDEQHDFGIDGESAHSSEEDTKKSFDFTGEIMKLNESGASDRASFVEQLEMAFKTPAKVDLQYDFGTHLRVEVPPLPPLPALGINSDATSGNTSSLRLSNLSQSQLLDVPDLSIVERSEAVSNLEDSSQFDNISVSKLMDVREPTILRTVNSDGTDVAEEQSGQSLELARSTRSARSAHSDGELDRSFKFGGPPKNLSPSQELTLSDIIPPPECARAISEASMLDDIEDDSVLRSIYAKLMDKENVSRPVSGISFAGFESFDEVRRGFEFSGDRSFYPPPPRGNRRGAHRRDESTFSMASVSSYGRVLNNGVKDPFDYGLPSLRERPSLEDISSISMSMTVDDTFAFMRDQPRRRVDSDASSFYFRPGGAGGGRGHSRRESSISVTSQVPLYNRSFGHHRRNDSSASSSSVAISYAKHGANSGFSAWARHRKDPSVDSLMSDVSVMNLGRPGIGDKMFDYAVNLGPLASISASPPENLDISESGYNHHTTYDSIMDDEQRSSMEDSLFVKTDQRSSVLYDSVFGNKASHPYTGGLLPHDQFRPLSVLSLNSTHGPIHEDDTMISMLGGGHVRRCSLVSLIDGSPCVRIEKRKHSAIQEAKAFKNVERHESPNKARIVEKPSIMSASSFQFGDERMIKAQQGLLERQSLEDSCFIADGEDMSGFCMNVFTRPLPAGSRSSTCTSSSGADTPPLSSSDGSSISGGSQSSIDLTHLDIALTNATHPLSNMGRSRARVRARGKGHRRRYSKSHVSRSSVYETIEEEVGPSPSKSVSSNPTTCQPIFIVDGDTMSIHSKGEETGWDDERGIVALRKFYALRDEADHTVLESKRIWTDTPFSIFAVQSFQPPQHPAGMQALLEHSVQSYGPLPSELRPRRIRSRTSSRPSPYPASRISKSSVVLSSSKDHTKVDYMSQVVTPVLRELPVFSNVSAAPTLDALKPFSPLEIDTIKTEQGAKDDKSSRPRVASTARRTALGWAKRSRGKSTDRKENMAVGKENLVGSGTTVTPGDTLRLNRPRPKGRTPGGRTPLSQNRPIRI